MRGQIDRWHESEDGLLCCKCYGAIYRLTHHQMNRNWQAAKEDYVQMWWRASNIPLKKTQMRCSVCSSKLLPHEVATCKKCKQKFDKWRVWII